jgi:WD40 repeat protein
MREAAQPPETGQAAGMRALRHWRAAGLCLVGLLFGATSAAAELVGHGGFVKGLAVSPDGRRIMTASFDYTLILWDLPEQTRLRDFNEHEGAVNAVAFLPDGSHAVSGSDDGTVRLWDVANGTVLHTFEGHQGKVAAVAVSPDGRLAASLPFRRTGASRPRLAGTARCGSGTWSRGAPRRCWKVTPTTSTRWPSRPTAAGC